MKITRLTKIAADKTKFGTLSDFFNFAEMYLEYASTKLQAVIVSQNENHYCFHQYKSDGNYQITRPINSRLMYKAADFPSAKKSFLRILKNARDVKSDKKRESINKAVYTLQMAIGSTLDALPVGNSNKARKINGDLFELLIQLVIKELGIDCRAGTIKVPVILQGKEQFRISYQHDLIIERDENIKLIGSIKTSSKDRLGKIFLDKFLYNKLTDTNTPHVAIFLNDIQRKRSRQKNKYGVSSTFLPGHFRTYSIKLSSLDGVYYCDIRPNMLTEDVLKDSIHSFDRFICEDIWKFA